MMFAAAIVTVALVTTFAVLAFRESAYRPAAAGAQGRTQDPMDGAVAVARRRLRRGEISARDYERVISILRD